MRFRGEENFFFPFFFLSFPFCEAGEQKAEEGVGLDSANWLRGIGGACGPFSFPLLCIGGVGQRALKRKERVIGRTFFFFPTVVKSLRASVMGVPGPFPFSPPR